MTKSIVVGTLHLAEQTTFTKSYETAAWFQEVVVEPGDYDVVASQKQVGGWYFAAALPGVKGKSNFQSLYGGVAVGQAYDRSTGEGEPDTYHLTVAYDQWALASLILAENEKRFSSREKITYAFDPEALDVQAVVEPVTRRVDLGVDTEGRARTSEGKRYQRLEAEVPTIGVRLTVNVRVPVTA